MPQCFAFSVIAEKRFLHALPLILAEPDARSILVEKFNARLLQNRNDPA